jgi:hypothetical protein
VTETLGQPEEQPEPRKRAKSPRNGQELPCGKDHPGSIQPGEVRNPEGSSAKQRAKAALEKVAQGPLLEAMLNRLFSIATGQSKDSDAIQAGRLASQLVGLATGDQEGASVTLRHEVVFVDRPDEQAHPSVFERREPKASEAEQPKADDDEVIDDV